MIIVIITAFKVITFKWIIASNEAAFKIFGGHLYFFGHSTGQMVCKLP